MLAKVARFELRYQLTSPIFWITAIVFFILTITLIVSDTIRIGWGGYVTRNSPFTTALMCMVMMTFAIFIATSFAANVVLRDDETGFGPIIRTTRLSKFSYLFGRFTGGFLVSCLAFASVPLALAIGAFWPGVDPETVGPFRLDTYLYAFFVMCVPTLFLLTASFFSLATITRSMLTTYVVALIVLMMYFLSAAYLARAEFRDMMSLLDPFALAAFRHSTEHWSPNERNTLLPPLLGPMLKNRAIWMAVSLALLALTWRSFRQDKPSDSKVSKAKAAAAEAEQARASAAGPLPRPTADSQSLGWGQLVALARFDVLSVLRSPGFFVLVGIAFVNTIIGLWYAGDDSVSITRPVTRVMINVLNEQFTLLPLIIAAYYAGELVWRDRERRVHEFIDATPAADWAFVIPKIIAITVVLFTMAIISVAGALCVQAIKGYTIFEFTHYLWWYVAPWLLEHAAVRGALGVRPDAGAEQVRRPAGDTADPRRAACVPALRLGEPSLHVREYFAGPAVGHERAGRIRGIRGVVSPVLERGRHDSRGACLRAVAPRCLRAAKGSLAAVAVATQGDGGMDSRCRGPRDGRRRRLHHVQHAHPQRMAHDRRQPAMGGGV